MDKMHREPAAAAAAATAAAAAKTQYEDPDDHGNAVASYNDLEPFIDRTPLDALINQVNNDPSSARGDGAEIMIIQEADFVRSDGTAYFGAPADLRVRTTQPSDVPPLVRDARPRDPH